MSTYVHVCECVSVWPGGDGYGCQGVTGAYESACLCHQAPAWKMLVCVLMNIHV